MRAVSGIASDIAQAPPQTDAPDRSLAADDSDDPDAAIDVVRRDSMDSVCSDAHWVDKCRVSTLRASNPEVSKRSWYRIIEIFMYAVLLIL